MEQYIKPNFPEHTVQLAQQMSNGFCMVEGCLACAVDLHHLLPNTKLNFKKFPLFLQSIFNCFVICRKHHDNYSLLKNIHITEQRAEKYEQWLRNFKEVNNVS